MLGLLLVLLGVLVVLASYDRHRSSAEVCADWETLLDPSQRRLVRSLACQAAATSGMLQDTYAAALRANREESLRLLGLLVGVIEEATEDRLARLRALARSLRMLSAVLPLPPLVPSRFRLSEVRSLTAVARVLHHVLMGSAARLQLRVATLGAAFRLVRRGARDGVRAAHGAHPARAHARVDAVVSDFGGLDEEHVESVKVVLASAAVFAGGGVDPRRH